jgi:lipopolysaccharide heptosyltransferase II
MNTADETLVQSMIRIENGTSTSAAEMPDFLERVLVIRLGAFGDVVRTIPAVDALKQRYPDSVITWLVDNSSADILHGLECVSSVIPLSRRGFFRDMASAVSAFSRVRRLRFTCILDFHGLFRSGLFSWLSGCKHRVGFARGHVREFNYIFSNIYVDPGTELISRYEKNQSLVELFGVKPESNPTRVNLTDEEKREIDSFVASFKTSRFVCLHPGTSWRGRYKRWFPDRFAVVADAIIEKYGLDVVLLFTDEEKEIAGEIASRTRGELRLSPKINQRQLAHLIGKANLYIGLDSGSMHVASIMRTPIVALFGPSDLIHNRPHDYAPYRIVQGNVECSPCRIRNCKNRICMEAIQPEHVIEAVEEIMDVPSPDQSPKR